MNDKIWDDACNDGKRLTSDSAPDPTVVPRRNRMDQWCPAEQAIQEAINRVEEAGAHPLLTDAVNLLAQARNKVADFIELPPPTPALTPWGEALKLLKAVEMKLPQSNLQEDITAFLDRHDKSREI